MTSLAAFMGIAGPVHAAAKPGIRVTSTIGVAYDCDRMVRFEIYFPSSYGEAPVQLKGLDRTLQGRASEPGVAKLAWCGNDPAYYGIVTLEVIAFSPYGAALSNWVKVNVGGTAPALKLTVKVKGRTISGTFVDPLAYANGHNKIVFYRGTKSAYTMTTNEQNTFSKSVKPGTYTIKATSLWSPDLPKTAEVTVR
ncbi:hypothetical protein [Actinoplanes sp. TFC3]|uniref:hypothetical protein n=1 Tax=Actinoplanes sp. TFC3 TaxID=1710355 RepID=UPI00137A728F|nr:hypothetical protein [Actinoplanes sp. TFC3]